MHNGDMTWFEVWLVSTVIVTAIAWYGTVKVINRINKPTTK